MNSTYSNFISTNNLSYSTPALRYHTCSDPTVGYAIDSRDRDAIGLVDDSSCSEEALVVAISRLVAKAQSENDHKELLTLIENTYNEALMSNGIHCEYIKIEVNEDEFLKVLDGDMQ